MSAAALLDYMMIMAVIAACWKLYDAIIPPGGADALTADPFVPAASPPSQAVPQDEIPTTPLGLELSRICAASGSISLATITEGAKLAYETILQAFAAGNLTPVRHLLGPDVATAFDAAIAERHDRGEFVQQLFIGIRTADVIGAQLDGTLAHIDIRFVAQLVSSVRDAAGKLVAGDPRLVLECPEIWSFERLTTTRDPAWMLVATGVEP